MARFIVVHTHQWDEQKLLELTKNAKKHINKKGGLNYQRTYCDFDGGKFFCEWEAPNKEAIQSLFTYMHIPFDNVYPVRLFTAAKMNFVD